LADWPDWRGQVVAVVASGPSAKKVNLKALEGRAKVIAIKGTWELVPFCDAVYGCDFPWWRHVRGLPDFKGLRLAYAPKAVEQYGCRRVLIPNPSGDQMLFDEVGTVGAGGNSGFQALNLAAQFGARKIILAGFDCTGEHWYGRNNWHGGSNPTDHNFRRWIAAMTIAARQLEARGVEVVNASPGSACKAFPIRGVAEALQEWSVPA
jgi:hypothetical protein